MIAIERLLEGRMTGKCTRGRKRLKLMSNIYVRELPMSQQRSKRKTDVCEEYGSDGSH